MTQLLDANLLIALLATHHAQYEAAQEWFQDAGQVATCPTVQGTFVRFLIRQGASPVYSVRALQTLLEQDRHEQWLDDLTYPEIDLSRVVGHGQVTNAYLAQLARCRGGRVATFDRGFAAAAPDVVDLLAP